MLPEWQDELVCLPPPSGKGAGPPPSALHRPCGVGPDGLTGVPIQVARRRGPACRGPSAATRCTAVHHSPLLKRERQCTGQSCNGHRPTSTRLGSCVCIRLSGRGGGGGAGTCFNFHSGSGGGTPPPWTPSPPHPSAQVHLKTWVLGRFFSHGKKILGAFGACHTLFTYCSMCAPYTLFSRLPCPNARC